MPDRDPEDLVLQFVGETYFKNTGKRLWLPDAALDALNHLISNHGPDGAAALYELWWKPGRRWSKWGGECGHSIGGLAHYFTWGKMVDDPEYKTLKTAFSSKFWRSPGGLKGCLAGIFTRMDSG